MLQISSLRNCIGLPLSIIYRNYREGLFRAGAFMSFVILEHTSIAQRMTAAKALKGWHGRAWHFLAKCISILSVLALLLLCPYTKESFDPLVELSTLGPAHTRARYM